MFLAAYLRLEFLGNFERLPVPAAQAGDDDAIGFPEQRHQHRVGGRLLFQQLVHDQIVVAHDRFHVTHGRADLRDVLFAPGKPERVFDPAFDFHHLEQRMIEQFFNPPVEQRV